MELTQLTSPFVLPAGIGWVQVQAGGTEGLSSLWGWCRLARKPLSKTFQPLQEAALENLLKPFRYWGVVTGGPVLTPTDSHLHAVQRGGKLQSFETFCMYFIWISCLLNSLLNCYFLTETMGLLNCLVLAIIGIAWMEGFNKLRSKRWQCKRLLMNPWILWIILLLR